MGYGKFCLMGAGCPGPSGEEDSPETLGSRDVVLGQFRLTLACPVPAYRGHRDVEGTGPVFFVCPAMLLRGSWHQFYVTVLMNSGLRGRILKEEDALGYSAS